MKRALLFVIPALLIGSAAASPQNPVASPQGAAASSNADVIFRSGVSLVRVDAELIDANGQVVSGLTKDDFLVQDEGIPQKLENFSFEEEPLDLILLFDTAGSMKNKLLNVVRATVFGFDELHKGDRVCVQTYGGTTSEILPFSTDLKLAFESIIIKVPGLRFGNGSMFESGARQAAYRLRGETASHRKRAVLVVTDKAASRISNDLEIVRELWKSNAVLSELVLGNASQTKLLNVGESAIVDQTGGAAIAAGKPGDAFRDSIHYIRSGYTMYYQLPQAASGSERKIQVELTPEALKRHPNARLRARSGYIVP
jgi:Ca-activated chloride channel homolog